MTKNLDEHIAALIEAEITAFATGTGAPMYSTEYRARVLAAFRAALIKPAPITVNFSGGLVQECWSVTRSDGKYFVIYLPSAGYFSLVIETGFGPVDMGVHGRAIDCFNTV